MASRRRKQKPLSRTKKSVPGRQAGKSQLTSPQKSSLQRRPAASTKNEDANSKSRGDLFLDLTTIELSDSDQAAIKAGSFQKYPDLRHLPLKEQLVIGKIVKALEPKRPPGRKRGMTPARIAEAMKLKELVDKDSNKRGALKRAAFQVYLDVQRDLAYDRARQTMQAWRRRVP
jgi:hypothetical protein